MTPEQRARLEGCAMAGKWLVGTKASDVAAALAKIDALEARVGQAEREREEALERLACMESHYAQLERANEQAEAEVAVLRQHSDDLDQKLTKYELQDAVRYARVEKEKEALVARVKELEAREGR